MRYPAYTAHETCSPLLGPLPSHWSVKRLKAVAVIVPSNVDKKVEEGEQPVRLCGYTDVYKNDRITSAIEFKAASATADEIAKFRVRLGDVIITKDSETADDIGVPALVEYEADDLICEYHLSIVRARPRQAFGPYLFWALRSRPSQAQFEMAAQGVTRFGLSVGGTGAAVLPVPPVDEQRVIAAFLDRETEKIDALIAKQERLIELLEEKRQAAIARAVTKGLDPDAQMKPSGVAWLGDIPAHWDLLPLKRDLAFLTSGSRNWAGQYSDDGALFIRIGNLTRDSIELDLREIQRVSVPEGTEAARTKTVEGDVLFSITAYLGSVAVVPAGLEPSHVSQHVALARLTQRRLLPRWAATVAASWLGRTYLETQGYGGTKVQLSLDDVAEMPMVVPPMDEQVDALQFVERLTVNITAVMQTARQLIGRLRQRRSSLIAAAVTGKIDVRDRATRDALDERLEAIA